MADYGLTDKGFKRKRYADVLESMEARARDLFGENVNLSERSPLGIFIRIVAWSVGITWQVAESVYHSSYVDTAEGVSLDYVAKYIGLVRRPAVKASGEVTFTGDSGTTIPEGFLVETEEESQFETTEEVSINGGEVNAGILAVEPGIESNVPSDTITIITNPTEGVDTVTNATNTEGGRERETDADFRYRYQESVAMAGASTLDSIRASLMEIPEIIAAHVVENATNETDADGRPPKSFESYVLGIEEEANDIGHAILNTKAAGIQAYGSDSVIVEDDAGNEHTIGYTQAVEVDIHVDVTLTVSPEFPADGEDRVEKAIIRHIGGTDADEEFHVGLSMGDDVIYNRLIDVIFGSSVGIDDVAVQISEDGTTWVEENIVIDTVEASKTEAGNVTVIKG